MITSMMDAKISMYFVKSEQPGWYPVTVIFKEPAVLGVVLYLFPLENSKYDRYIWKGKVRYLTEFLIYP